MAYKKKSDSSVVGASEVKSPPAEPKILEVKGDKVDEMFANGYKYLGKEKRPFEDTPSQNYWIYRFQKGK